MIPVKTFLVPVLDDDGNVVADMPFTMSTQCGTCKHITEALKCEAFPNGIPKAILEGEFDHTQPYPGDNGILYEKI
jgi:hypothetical protein